jgi:hypothetical protein
MGLTSSQTPASALHHGGDLIAVFEAAFEDGEGQRIEEVLERGPPSQQQVVCGRHG